MEYLEGIWLEINAIEQVSDQYCLMLDEDVVEDARNGGNQALEYLIYKYKNFVRAKARSYFLIGADREDIVQEGMIGLYKAIRDFRPDKLSSFPRFCGVMYYSTDYHSDKDSYSAKAYTFKFLCVS